MNNTKHNPWAEITRLRAENARLTAELEAARKVADVNKKGCDLFSAKAERLRCELVAAKKVAESAVRIVQAVRKWILTNDRKSEFQAMIEIRAAADAYRKLTEAPPLESRIAANLENLDAKAAAVVGVYREGGDVEC